MNKFLDALLERHGLKAALLLSATFVVVWIFAHNTAEPGTEISVFYGLVKYTKSSGPKNIANTPHYSFDSDRSSTEPFENEQLENKSPLSEPGNSTRQFSSHEIIVVESFDRVYLNKRPKDLLESTSSLTDLQGGLFEEQNYQGKWVRIKGPVETIMGTSSSATVVFHVDGIVTRVNMKKEFIKSLSHIQKGDVITVDGTANDLGNIGPDFKNGELIATE